MKRQFKLNYFVIPAITVAVIYLGKCFVSSGMSWYEALKAPAISIPQSVDSVIWLFIYVCATASVLLIWNKHKHERYFYRIMTLFACNAFLNVMWSYVFFVRHMIAASVIIAILIIVTLIGLLYYIYPKCKKAAYLLMPYLVWMGFALYMNYQVWMLNIG